MLRFPRECHGCFQTCRSRLFLLQIDVKRRTEQREPAADDQQASMLGQCLLPSQQACHVRRMAPHTLQEILRWGHGIGRGQIIKCALKPLERLRPYVTRPHAPRQLPCVLFVIVSDTTADVPWINGHGCGGIRREKSVQLVGCRLQKFGDLRTLMRLRISLTTLPAVHRGSIHSHGFRK
ncbi:hypothetical protein SBI_06783 [Streptomyces bingchenggensis BCW-1]|uniref:Uncharacterized protein n=1 Tax=Streptomyces bingchenggensis (strain BCW-1) TaxID=749414 RepID=D7BZJ8_STRBB|nr:hypothetical protein SBI_06783 [Streptomyces bingchenggensis BCW-1]